MYLVLLNTKISFYPLWIGISIVTYWLGYIGIYKFGIIEERKKLKRYSKETTATYSIVEKQKSNHIVALESLIIDQKRFLDSDLTLDKIAEELNLSKSYLSRVINTELGVGFVNDNNQEQFKDENIPICYAIKELNSVLGFNLQPIIHFFIYLIRNHLIEFNWFKWFDNNVVHT